MERNEEHDLTIIIHGQHKGIGKQRGNEIFVPYSLLEQVYQSTSKYNSKDKIFAIEATGLKALDIPHYDYKGNYLHYDKNRVENWNVTFDREGIPRTNYTFGKYYNPSTIAHYGLQHYSLFLINNNQENKLKFLKVSEWFLQQQDNKGGWAYQFDHDFYPRRLEKIKAPWYSAIGLGMAFSVLTRALHLTKNKKYTTCALKALRFFQTPTQKNGILTKFEDKFSFYEECPTDPPSYILNGFMFSLIGLYDLYSITGNKEAHNLYNQGIVTLKRMLPLYDLGYRTAYDLTHFTTEAGYPNVGTWGYHITHIHLLAALYSIEGDQKMKEAVSRWKGYLKGQYKF